MPQSERPASKAPAPPPGLGAFRVGPRAEICDLESFEQWLHCWRADLVSLQAHLEKAGRTRDDLYVVTAAEASVVDSVIFHLNEARGRSSAPH